MSAVRSTLISLALLASAALAIEENSPDLYVLYYAEPWLTGSCANGTNLSPIDVEATVPAPAGWETNVDFGVKSGLSVYSTGHGMQLQWTASDDQASTVVQARGDSISALFTTEGDLQPMRYAAEGHIVTYIAEGEAPAEWGCDTYWQTMDASDLVLEKCVAVFGVLYALGTETEPMLAEIISNSPLEAHTSVPLPGTVNLNSMLPASMDSYISYRGSLTTPDCNEGLRWHLFTEPMTITAADQQLMEVKQTDTFIMSGDKAVKMNFRMNTQYIQDINDRVVYRAGAEAGALSSATATESTSVAAAATPVPAPSSAVGVPMLRAGLAGLAVLAVYLM